MGVAANASGGQLLTQIGYLLVQRIAATQQAEAGIDTAHTQLLAAQTTHTSSAQTVEQDTAAAHTHPTHSVQDLTHFLNTAGNAPYCLARGLARRIVKLLVPHTQSQSGSQTGLLQVRSFV